ncbi:hypothetical protein F2P81_010642 [Scophthalmus maximus]|uniref:Girdin-like n=1 Tax=Scophthalmus maximus TaxID=52904 RepID=A0A6A4T0D6_SCOMX|nr:hypothetical protein F2P81_010642 [Scophthalmus maximus]
MESGVFLPCLDQFMLSPLVTWVKTFVPNDGGLHLDLSELLDGVFLSDIMTQINPSAAPQGANNVSRDPGQRIQNLNCLVQQIKSYYLCEKKEQYIERIQTLDFDTKAAIAAHIQELTHSQENVLDLQWLEASEMNADEVEAIARSMATHLRHLLDQRDTHLETIAELVQEKEGVVSSLSSPSSPQSGSYSPSIQQQQQAGSHQHLAVELADSKAKIRRLRQEVEEKSEQMLDGRHELENMEAELKRIQQENSQLLVDARAARTYRDELDALRERAIKADKLESEVGRYREQLHKMEFYKAKVEELKEDNRVLQETKEVLEDQLAGWRARSDKIHQLEKHSLMLKAQVHDMEQEREADQRRIEELQEENLTLCLAQRRSMEESQHLGWELEQLSKTTENSQDRKVQRLEAEVQELEAENQSLQATLEELRISARRLEQLEAEKQSLEQETAALEKDKRQLEKENRRLRQQAEIQEANLDSSNVCMAGLEREMRFLVKEVEGLRETAERVKGLEGDNRELSKQAAIDQRTLATLREELVSEKLKTQQRHNELEKLSHELEMKVLSQAEHQAPDSSRFKMLESELESSLKRSLQIKEDKMAALEARLQESSTLNQQLRQELRTVRLSCEALQQRQEEESGSSPPTQTGKAMSEWLRESQEATRELLKLKDRLIEVERNNATLEAERQAAQAQLRQLESQSDSQQAQILALQRQAASLQENNTALQTHNANLQVEKSTLNSQSASLMAQNAQLQQQQSGTESERDGAAREREELRGVHEQLLRDHERLAALHERQATEYEALMGKHGCLKNAHRTLELEHRTLQDRYNSLLQQRAKLEDLEKDLREEQMRMALEKEQHKTTAAECGRLRDEKDWLNQTYRQLLNDNELLTADHKQLKSQLNEVKLEHTWLEADFSKLKKEFQQLDIASTKLNNQCELLGQLKGNLEEENRHLLGQIETVMLQNRTLLEQSMESKDLFHVEERQYIDKLHDLRRQKEKLEEKIMDQYKFYEPSPPRRRGNWITLKLKKLMKSSIREHGPERPPTPTHPGVTEPHLPGHDSSSFLSSEGSGGSAFTSPQRNNNKDSNDSAVPLGFEDNDELQNHALNGAQSRAHSESSGEFSLSLENEPWSNGSSPVQQPPSRRSSSSYQPPSDTSTPQHKGKASTMPTTGSQSSDLQSTPKQKDLGLSQDFWLTRGTKSIRKGSRGKVIRRSSDSGGKGKTNTEFSGNSRSSSIKADTARASAISPITVLYVQGKSSSVSGCLNCFSTPLGKEGRLKGPRPPNGLPRASSVISTAEGSSRRSSVNSDCRVTVKADALQTQATAEGSSREETASTDQQPHPDTKHSEPEPVPPLKPPRDPALVVATDCPKTPVQESLLGSSFTFNSVFSNTIFSDSVVTTATGPDALDDDQTFLCLNPPQVQGGRVQSEEAAPSAPLALLGVDSEQSRGLEEKDKPLTIA